MSNWQEFLAGTDPQSASSALRLNLARIANVPTLQLSAVANHSYTIQWRTNLATGSWSNLVAIPAVATNRSMNIPVNALNSPANYFRVIIPSP
jgi:hypothetical protein